MIKCEEVSYEEGSTCPEDDCLGTLEIAPSENCRCHINPPCSSCTDAGYICNRCSWRSHDPKVYEEYEPTQITRYAKDSRRDQWTSTHVDNPFNSTPFTRCCSIAAIDTKRCPNCGAQISYHDDGLSELRRTIPAGHCLMCGKKRGDMTIAGNCCC